MSLSAFLKQNAFKELEEEVIVSDRFIDEEGKVIPFKLKAITSRETEAIRQRCIVKNKAGATIDMDMLKFQRLLAAACITYPNLKDVELQDSYGVHGEGELLESMLLVGEYQLLLQNIERINGLKPFNTLVEEAKN